MKSCDERGEDKEGEERGRRRRRGEGGGREREEEKREGVKERGQIRI